MCFIRESILWFEMTPTCKVCLRACWSTQPEVIQVSMYSVGPGTLLLPPGWDASPSQGSPPPPPRLYPFTLQGEERHYGSESVLLKNTTN